METNIELVTPIFIVESETGRTITVAFSDHEADRLLVQLHNKTRRPHHATR